MQHALEEEKAARRAATEVEVVEKMWELEQAQFNAQRREHEHKLLITRHGLKQKEIRVTVCTRDAEPNRPTSSWQSGRTRTTKVAVLLREPREHSGVNTLCCNEQFDFRQVCRVSAAPCST